MIERHRPAMISFGFLPFFCSVTMLLFMNTVQRLPRSAGAFDSKAALAMLLVGMLNVDAKLSRNDPQPEEHASFTTTLVITPLSIQIAFMS